MSTQTAKMVDIATMTIAAAETEEAIGSMDESEPTHDVELQEQIKQVGPAANWLLHSTHHTPLHYTLSGESDRVGD